MEDLSINGIKTVNAVIGTHGMGEEADIFGSAIMDIAVGTISLKKETGGISPCTISQGFVNDVAINN